VSAWLAKARSGSRPRRRPARGVPSPMEVLVEVRPIVLSIVKESIGVEEFNDSRSSLARPVNSSVSRSAGPPSYCRRASAGAVVRVDGCDAARAVIARYDYHVLNGVDLGRELHRIMDRGGGRYKPLLDHIARRKGRRQAMIRVRQRRRSAPPPILTPGQMERTREACASWDTDTTVARVGPGQAAVDAAGGDRRSAGRSVGVAASRLAHRLGDTPFIEVVARDRPHGVRAKRGYRRLYVSDELDGLYGEYVWQLCQAGADVATDGLRCY
jgi:hypothetical protein